MCMCTGTACLWQLENNLQKLVLLFHCLRLGARTLVLRVGSNLYPLSTELSHGPEMDKPNTQSAAFRGICPLPAPLLGREPKMLWMLDKCQSLSHTFHPWMTCFFMNFGVDVSTLLENLPIVKTAVKSLLIFHSSGWRKALNQNIQR